jgi:ribosome-binding factor A
VNRHQEQLASELRRVIQEIIDRGLSDPRISGLITATSVRITDDEQSAIVMISVLPAEKQKLTMHGLKSAAAHFRHLAGEKIRTRHIPLLIFKLDESGKKQSAVMEAISKATAEREQREAKSGGTPPQTAYPVIQPPENPRP